MDPFLHDRYRSLPAIPANLFGNRISQPDIATNKNCEKKNNPAIPVKNDKGSDRERYVIKHYKWGIIKTRYPDMTKIKASPKQHTCRNLFREAVIYAQPVIADPAKDAAWQKKLRRRKGVYNEAV